MTSEEKARLAAAAAEDLKATQIVVLDVEGQTHIADFFVICSGTSDTHIRAIADSVIEKLQENGAGKPRREGVQAAQWVLLDYDDVVVHVFSAEQREFYNLESFWSGARVLELTEEARGQRQPAAAAA